MRYPVRERLMGYLYGVRHVSGTTTEDNLLFKTVPTDTNLCEKIELLGLRAELSLTKREAEEIRSALSAAVAMLEVLCAELFAL